VHSVVAGIKVRGCALGGNLELRMENPPTDLGATIFISSSEKMVNTLAHEIGHHLIGAHHSTEDEQNFMFGETHKRVFLDPSEVGPGQLPYEMVPIKNQNKITEDQCDDARESDLLQDKKLDGD
jgi:hypothetical protein